MFLIDIFRPAAARGLKIIRGSQILCNAEMSLKGVGNIGVAQEVSMGGG